MARNLEVEFVNDNEITGVLSEGPPTLSKTSIAGLKQNRSIAKRNLTRKRNEIENIFDKFENSNEITEKISELKFALERLKNAHAHYHKTISEAETEEIQESFDYFNFEEIKVKNLISALLQRQNLLSKEKVDEGLIPAEDPSDSISNAETRTSIATCSSISSARARASARKAKFQAEANALQRLQILQQEELKLQQKKEQLKLETELAKAQAEERALAEAEGISIYDSSSVKSAPRVSAWVEKIRENNNNPSNIPEKIQSTSPDKKLNPEAKEWCNNNHQEPIQLTQSAPFMQELENLLIQQQQNTLALMLPQPELPTFGGDPIEYCNFIRSFENLIEARTDNCSARLYYLIQSTSGDLQKYAHGHATVVETYAFLDSGSNTTFRTKELMDQLHATGRETMLSLATLGIESNQTKTSVLSLQVNDLDENNIIDLPFVFSTPRLPATMENRANNLDLCKFPHLQEINLADIDADIGLLIGSNVPRALEPREVKSGKPGEPYATRTDLGWVINGPLMRSGDSHHTANLIKTDVDLSMQFNKYCELDFNDSSYNSKAAIHKRIKEL
eukprot:gene21083-23139_t